MHPTWKLTVGACQFQTHAKDASCQQILQHVGRFEVVAFAVFDVEMFERIEADGPVCRINVPNDLDRCAAGKMFVDTVPSNQFTDAANFEHPAVLQIAELTNEPCASQAWLRSLDFKAASGEECT